MTLIDPDCRDPHKHATCAGGPCQCGCHLPPETVARMAAALQMIVDHHQPDLSATPSSLTCTACSHLSGLPVPWPCCDRQAVGTLIVDHSNRLLPDPP